MGRASRCKAQNTKTTCLVEEVHSRVAHAHAHAATCDFILPIDGVTCMYGPAERGRITAPCRSRAAAGNAGAITLGWALQGRRGGLPAILDCGMPLPMPTQDLATGDS